MGNAAPIPLYVNTVKAAAIDFVFYSDGKGYYIFKFKGEKKMINFDKNKKFFLLKGTEIISEGTAIEICAETGRKMHAMRSIFYVTHQRRKDREFLQSNRKYLALIYEEDLPIYLDEERLDPKKFALYQGEELVAIGTCEELAELLNTNVRNVMFYKYEYYYKRYLDKAGLMKKKRNKTSRVLVEID